MASNKPISSYGVYLMYKDTEGGVNDWTKLVDIKNFPDLHDKPNMLSTQTLSDMSETQILGTRKASEKEFTANYTKADLQKIEALKGKDLDVAVWFGANTNGEPQGAEGKFEGKGMIGVSVAGAGVDAVLEMKISLAMSKPFDKVM